MDEGFTHWCEGCFRRAGNVFIVFSLFVSRENVSLGWGFCVIKRMLSCVRRSMAMRAAKIFGVAAT